MISIRNKDEGSFAFRHFQQKNEIEAIDDIHSTISLKSLTCIPAFQSFSLEELRLIDYNNKSKMNGVSKVYGINPPERLNEYSYSNVYSNNCNTNGSSSNQYSVFNTSNRSNNPNDGTHDNNAFPSQYYFKTYNDNTSNLFKYNNSNSNGSSNPFENSNSNLNNNITSNNPANNTPNPFQIKSSNLFNTMNQFTNSTSINQNPFTSANSSNYPFSNQNGSLVSNSNPFCNNIPSTTPSSYPSNNYTNTTNPFEIKSNNAMNQNYTNINYCFPPSISHIANPFNPTHQINLFDSSLYQTNKNSFDKYINQLNQIPGSLLNPPSFYYPFQNNNPYPLQAVSLSEVNANSSNKKDFKIRVKSDKNVDDDSSFNMKKIEQIVQTISLTYNSNKEKDGEILKQNEININTNNQKSKKKKEESTNKIYRSIKLHWLNKPDSITSSINCISFNDMKTSLRDIKSYIMKQILNRNKTLFFFLLDDIVLYNNSDKTPLKKLKDIINDNIWFEVKKKETKGVSIDLSQNCLEQYKEHQEDKEDQDNDNDKDKSYIPIITTLSTHPSIDEIQSMTKKQLRSLNNFSVYNENGKINFINPVDITYLNIDNIVKINLLKIEVYSNEIPPKVGTKLNQKSQIEIYNIFQGNLTTENILESIKDYIKQFEGTFVSFSNGILKFELDSFSF